MGKGAASLDSAPAGNPAFLSTHWSLVLQAAQENSPHAAEALNQLCRAYWFPLYAWVRRKGRSPEEAKDCTQAFFARLLEKKYLKLADRERGRFRTFLLTSLDRFLINEWRKEQAEKQGGKAVFISLDLLEAEGCYQAGPASPELTPDQVFDKRWALELLEQVLSQLRLEYEADGRKELFHSLKPFMWGEKSSCSQAEIAAQLGMKEAAVAQAVHRLRQRYGEVLRAEVAATVAAPGDVDNELRHLLRAVSS